MSEYFFCRMGQHDARMSELKRGTLTQKNTGKCKKCHADYSKNHHMIKKSNISPENYIACNDCDRMMHKLASKVRLDGTQLVIDRCKFCGSSDIEGLV